MHTKYKWPSFVTEWKTPWNFLRMPLHKEGILSCISDKQPSSSHLLGAPKLRWPRAPRFRPCKEPFMLRWFLVCLVSFWVAMRIVSHSQGSIVRDDMAEGSSLSIVVKKIKYYSNCWKQHRSELLKHFMFFLAQRLRTFWNVLDFFLAKSACKGLGR